MLNVKVNAMSDRALYATMNAMLDDALNAILIDHVERHFGRHLVRHVGCASESDISPPAAAMSSPCFDDTPLLPQCESPSDLLETDAKMRHCLALVADRAQSIVSQVSGLLSMNTALVYSTGGIGASVEDLRYCVEQLVALQNHALSKYPELRVTTPLQPSPVASEDFRCRSPIDAMVVDVRPREYTLPSTPPTPAITSESYAQPPPPLSLDDRKVLLFGAVDVGGEVMYVAAPFLGDKASLEQAEIVSHQQMVDMQDVVAEWNERPLLPAVFACNGAWQAGPLCAQVNANNLFALIKWAEDTNVGLHNHIASE